MTANENDKILETLKEIQELTTEQKNPASKDIDSLDTHSLLELIHSEDKTVPQVVRKAIPQIGEVVESAVRSIKSGSRLVYVGAGTSGRLGVLDAAECPPTYGVPPDWVVGMIAGGDLALKYAQEGSEDDVEQAEIDFEKFNISSKDTVLGISARGNTPYVRTILKKADLIGAWTGLLCCNKIKKSDDLNTLISLEVGPEVITGSTRMKAGLATKMALTMISTGTMVKLGRVKGNLMVDLQPNSDKLKARMIKIIMESKGVNIEQAMDILHNAEFDLRKALE